MSEALPLVESEDLVLVRDSARGLLQDAWPASRAVAAAKDAAALKDMWRKAALQGCVDWAKANGVTLIEESHMAIIRDKRSKEKK